MSLKDSKHVFEQTETKKLSEELLSLAEICKQEPLTLGKLVHSVSPRSHALLTLFLSFPFILPIPVPGLSIILGLIIMIAGVRMAFGLGPWIPKAFADRGVPGSVMVAIFERAARVMKKFERWIRPRGRFLHNYFLMRITTASMIAVSGFLLALPLPPGTNFPPGITIIFLSVGTLETDGVFLTMGWLSFAVMAALIALIPIYGVDFVLRYLQNPIF